MIQPITSLQSIIFAQINLLVHLGIENVGLKEDGLICHWAHVGREILGRQGLCNSFDCSAESDFVYEERQSFIHL